ncbi:uncharacterized protein [Physcomitrium patens]|uniref:Uncharacterized protein n=1 Tax=Physcomitrium patens TaxID=3218 RepID=A0A7I4DUA6_PHYPA|nr:uncharacterized protein LOC112282872 isoform X2 [Physcomitrium patens]|eukprot:XP_024376764.1 uncharacterized protein LOC112282872 isoform X2 [Physcomitrella patens]
MSRVEPPPEDRKLSSVKSWFSRSVSFGGIHGSSAALAAGAASKGLPEGNGHNGEDQDTWGGFNTTLGKHLSMRRSKVSTEAEKESALGSPSMTPRNVTPLIPLTPLRWKSNPSEQEEQQKAAVTVERSRLGLVATNAAVPSEEHSGNSFPVKESEAEKKVDQDVYVQTKAVQSTADADAEIVGMESPSGQDMTSPSGDDIMPMRIDFLRARLISERSASKAAKQQIQDLGTKVMELEEKLEQVMEDKKKAEKCAEDALLKLLNGDFAQVADCTARVVLSRASFNTSEGLHITSGPASGGEEIKEEVRRAGNSVGAFFRTDSIGSSSESKDSEDSRKKSSQVGSEHQYDVDGHGDPWVTPQNVFVMEGESPKKQDNRAAIGNRLRQMWSQISADMSALAKDGTQEELVQEQLMSWMDQAPAVLQERTPQKLMQEMQGNGGLQRKAICSQDSHFGLSPPEGIQDRSHVQTVAKRGEAMLEEYEAHQRVQREWERNYYESKRRLGQSDQHDYPRSEYKSGPKDAVHDFGTSRDVSHRSKSSINFSHDHMLKSDSRMEVHPDSESWAVNRHDRNTAMDRKYNDDSIDHRQRLAYPAGMEHPQLQAELSAPLPRQREGEHPYRSYHQSEKRYRHGQRRSRSADSGNWPALEDYGVMDVPHQQRNLSGEIRPSNSSRREGKNYKHDDRDYRRSYEDDSRLGHEPSYGMPGHREDKYLEINGSGYHVPPQAKLFLGYGPAYDAPRDQSPTLQQDRVSNKSSVSDVLLRLQKAKASIQKSGSDLTKGSSDYVKPERGMDPRAQYSTLQLSEPSNLTRSVVENHDLGSGNIRSSNSSPSLLDLRPAANGHRSYYVDQLNVVRGIDFFH